jgi:hypothetical protein
LKWQTVTDVEFPMKQHRLVYLCMLTDIMEKGICLKNGVGTAFINPSLFFVTGL